MPDLSNAVAQFTYSDEQKNAKGHCAVSSSNDSRRLA
jgi:hypothetical protein